MMLVLTILFINYTTCMISKFNFKKINIKLDSVEPYKFLDSKSGKGMEGHDTRNISVDSEEEMFRISKYLEMKKILKTLENDKVGEHDKILIIYNYDLLNDSSIAINLLRAGLLDDWNFNITL